MLTALLATSSTAAVIWLTAVAAWSISALCWCKPRLVSSVTVCSSSDAEASWSDEAAICRMVSRRLVCMRLNARSSKAGSSRPTTWISRVRSPVATRSATATASANGRTILRVSRVAMAASASTITNSAPISAWNASSATSLLRCEACSALVPL